MAKARYLDYPDAMTMMASGASRRQIEKAMASYSYVMLCRHALQELLQEKLADPSVVFSLGDDLGAQDLAVLLIYMRLPMFSEASCLNGPIKEFADRESEAFQAWASQTQRFEWPHDATALAKLADRIASLCRMWIGNFSATAPRSAWFLENIQSPGRLQLRCDLRDWTILAESTKKGVPAQVVRENSVLSEREKLLARFPSGAVVEPAPKPPETPLTHYQIAAGQGNAVAQMYLADCYSSGSGVIKDEVEAYAYYNLAGISIPEAKVQLAKLEAKLSRAEISAGQVRSRELLRKVNEKGTSGV